MELFIITDLFRLQKNETHTRVISLICAFSFHLHLDMRSSMVSAWKSCFYSGRELSKYWNSHVSSPENHFVEKVKDSVITPWKAFVKTRFWLKDKQRNTKGSSEIEKILEYWMWVLTLSEAEKIWGHYKPGSHFVTSRHKCSRWTLCGWNEIAATRRVNDLLKSKKAYVRCFNLIYSFKSQQDRNYIRNRTIHKAHVKT